MNENRMVPALLRAALGVASIIPLGGGCGGSAPQASAATNATASTPAAQPPPAYAAAPPPGYPGAPATAYPPQAAYTAPAPQPTGYPAPAQTGYPGYPAPAAAPPPVGTPAASGNATPPGPLAPTDPNSLQGILAGLQGALQGTLVSPGGGALPADLTEAGLKAQAFRLAQGMQPEGPELKQDLPEGQHAVMMVTLQAGKCYSILGFSAPGAIRDVDLNLLAPPFYMTLAGQDLTHNNTPSIGAAPSPMCPVIAIPLQYKLDVFARSGSGTVAVQLYSKTKS